MLKVMQAVNYEPAEMISNENEQPTNKTSRMSPVYNAEKWRASDRGKTGTQNCNNE